MSLKLFYILPDNVAGQTEVYNPTALQGYVYRLSDPISEKLQANEPTVILLKHLGGDQYKIISRVPWPNSQNSTVALLTAGDQNGTGTGTNTIVPISGQELNLGTAWGLSKGSSISLFAALLILLILVNQQQ